MLPTGSLTLSLHAAGLGVVFAMLSAPTLQAQANLQQGLPLAVQPILLQGQQEVQKTRGQASIAGLVLDANQGLVPGAKVLLDTLSATGEDAPPTGTQSETVTSDAGGNFRFSGLPAGRYRLTISAADLETFISSPIVLKDREQYELPNIALPVAKTSADITVRVTEQQLAEEQINAEMKQRVLGIIPNFYMSFVWDAAPLQPKQKFKMAVRARSDPFSFFAAAVAAGIEQGRNTYPSFGQGAEGYAKRYGTIYATGTLSRFFGSAVYPALFHQDPRYFYKGSGTVGQRAWYAATRSVVARGDNGKWQPNYSHIFGGMTAGAISNLYYPARERGVALTFENAALGIVFTGVGNIVREFALRHLTKGVSPYHQGQKPIDPKQSPVAAP